MPKGIYTRKPVAAKRVQVRNINDWRSKINVGELMGYLAAHSKGKRKMLPTQIKAAEILLRKVVPDVARTEHVGLDEGPIMIETKVDPTEAYMAMLKGPKAK